MVEGARLERVYRSKAYREFESLSLRHLGARPCFRIRRFQPLTVESLRGLSHVERLNSSALFFQESASALASATSRIKIRQSGAT